MCTQASCAPGQSGTQCIGKNLVCNQATPDASTNNEVVNCSPQPYCYQYQNNTTCIGTKKNIKPCIVPTPSAKYEINNGLVRGKSCQNVRNNPHSSSSDEHKAWKVGDCPQTLESGKLCQPTCEKGFTVSPGKTKCNLGTLTIAKCKSNNCNGNDVNPSGKISISPSTNPYPTASPEHKVWGKGDCGQKLDSGRTCQPTCAMVTQLVGKLHKHGLLIPAV